MTVGAATESEMKEKKARVEDALNATRAAIEEGIVPGGGVALIRAVPALAGLRFDDDRKYGVNVIRRAVEEPLRQIARNAGAEGSIVAEVAARAWLRLQRSAPKYEDLVSRGHRSNQKGTALQNAARGR